MTFILAEAGTNHLGSAILAADYVRAAAKAGCDGVKFQLFTKSELFCPMEGDERRKERWDRSVMSLEEWKIVRDFAREADIKFVVSVFQHDGIDIANELDLDYMKVASRAAPTFPWESWKKNGLFIVSQGLYTPDMPTAAIVLQCVMKYPAPLRECFWHGGGTGYLTDGISDHSGTVWPAIDACFEGAKMVEVHFSLGDAGPDAPVCLTTDQLKLICEARDAAAAMRED